MVKVGVAQVFGPAAADSRAASTRRCRFAGDAVDRALVGVADDGDDETLRCVHGDADVHVLVLRVQRRGGRARAVAGDLDQQIGEGGRWFGVLGGLSAQVDQGRGVGVGGQRDGDDLGGGGA